MTRILVYASERRDDSAQLSKMAPLALYDQIFLFGDSITEFSEQQVGFGFVPQVRADYIRKLDVINRGLSGYNTDLALRVLKYVIPSPNEAKIRLMTVFLGANDSCFPQERGNQCVPLPTFKKNIIKIIQSPYVTAHSPRILLITPPPIDERTQRAMDLTRGYTELRRSAENTKKYAEAVREAGAELGLPVCDLWTRFMELAGWTPGAPLPGSDVLPPNPKLAELLSDGLHLTPAGYRVWYEEFTRIVRELWPDLVPDQLPFVLPPWSEFPDDWTGPPQQR